MISRENEITNTFNNYVMNLMLLGTKNSPKNLIGNRIVEKYHKNNILMSKTYGIDIYFLTLKMNKDSMINVQIWDLNLKDLINQTLNYFTNIIDILMIVINKSSFNKIQSEFSSIKKVGKYEKYILHNRKKKDQTLKRETSISTFSKNNNFRYFKISAKNGENFTYFRTELIDTIKRIWNKLVHMKDLFSPKDSPFFRCCLFSR